jgi:hypothetical protein
MEIPILPGGFGISGLVGRCACIAHRRAPTLKSRNNNLEDVRSHLWKRGVAARTLELSIKRGTNGWKPVLGGQPQDFRLIASRRGPRGTIQVMLLTPGSHAAKTVMLQAGPPDDPAWDDACNQAICPRGLLLCP